MRSRDDCIYACLFHFLFIHLRDLKFRYSSYINDELFLGSPQSDISLQILVELLPRALPLSRPCWLAFQRGISYWEKVRPFLRKFLIWWKMDSENDTIGKLLGNVFRFKCLFSIIFIFPVCLFWSNKDVISPKVSRL